MSQNAAALKPFESFDAEHEATGFGMWIFIGSEIMFFGALFGAYVILRSEYGSAFAEASRLTDIALGTANTAVLLTSSLTMALAVRAAALGQRSATTTFLVLTMLLGAVFLGIKSLEYVHDFEQHLVPGYNFDRTGANALGVNALGVQLFFWLYFVMTGLHAVHLTIGIGLLAVIAVRARRSMRAGSSHEVELTGLYWHLIDIVWIFLYPLLYLVARA